MEPRFFLNVIALGVLFYYFRLMMFSLVWPRLILPVLFLFLLPGCFPKTGASLDEQKDPYFLKGKSRVDMMDYQGAIQAYEKALEANPNNASAHFELGWLYEEKVQDHAAAIYHFQKHLALRPDSPMAEIVRQRITSCKLELAKTVSFALLNKHVQREVDRLASQNQALQQQIKQLEVELIKARQAQPVQASPDRAPLTSEILEANKRGAASQVTPSPPVFAESPGARLERMAQNGGSNPGSMGTYTIQKGDTYYSIARRRGLDPKALQAANPGIPPQNLIPGNTIRIPAQ